MKNRTVFRTAVLAATAALGGLAGADQEEPAVTLHCKPPAARARVPRLRLDGTAPYPDRAVLRMHLARQFEMWAGGRLLPTSIGGSGGFVEVRNRKFVYEPIFEGPGQYLIRVEFNLESQPEPLRESFKKHPPRKDWTFQFAAWGDELAGQIGKLPEVDQIAAEAQELLRRYEKACVSEASWKAEAKELTKESSRLMAKIEGEKHDLKAVFPASLNQLFYTVRSIRGTSEFFVWENGKFAGGRSYHAENQKIKTHRDEDFTFENLRRYVEEVPSLAGREFALWVVKDLRRTEGKLSSAMQEVLKANAAHAGLAPFAERLEKAAPADLELLEAEIRGAPAQPPKPPEEKPKSQDDKPKSPGKSS
ncbi:MAG: hypothetical protein ACK44W_04120 [Planctomycetota bacterium]